MELLFVHLIVLSFLFSVISTDSFCKVEGPCYCILQNSTRIDLSSIGQVNKPRFTDVPYMKNMSDLSQIALFSYDPCFPFTETNTESITKSPEKPCIGVAGCKFTPGGSKGTPSEIHAIAVHNTAKFYERDGTMHINYTVPGSDSNMTVRLICDESVEYELAVIDEIDEFSHVFNLTSRCACPDKCPSVMPPDDPENHGLSTGSILLIIFFTTLAIYLVLGVTYNFCNGATGLEMLPHLKFWNELPQLIIDGFLFTCSCFSRRTAGGGSYSDL